MMDYIIRFVQAHVTFRKPEINALAELYGLAVEWLFYSDDSPFAIIRFIGNDVPAKAARRLISRSILAMNIYELWGIGLDYDSLHQDTRKRTEQLWPTFTLESFRFEIDSFRGKRDSDQRRAIIESFSYLNFQGPIVMSAPQHQFRVFEDFELNGVSPTRLLFGRLLGTGGRKAITTYDLKKRKYIATTSMDAELSLVTANMALAAPGRLAYDPFMGTGSFPVSCAHFGSVVFGSDMDGRTIRGKGGLSVKSNFDQYKTPGHYLGGFVADITNSPVRIKRCLDSIVCDPPYGVREGLKVLGSTRHSGQEVVMLSDGTPAHLQTDFVPPKKPYSFLRLLDDILDFSAHTLLDHGRLCMWMPVAVGGNDTTTSIDEADAASKAEAIDIKAELAIPQHPALEVVSLSVQDFNKWSRRLLVYRRLTDAAVDKSYLQAYQTARLTIQNTPAIRGTADELNDFRRQYFQGFKSAT